MHQSKRVFVSLLILTIFASACGRGGGTICRHGATTPSTTTSFGSIDSGNGSGSQGEKDCKQLE